MKEVDEPVLVFVAHIKKATADAVDVLAPPVMKETVVDVLVLCIMKIIHEEVMDFERFCERTG